MIALNDRRAVIEWAGRLHAFPVQKKDDPDQVEILRPGDDEAGWKRVGWKQLFAPLDRGSLLVVIEAADAFEHRILPRAKARAELPPTAFGPPWWQRLLHEVWIDRPVSA